MNYDFEKPIEDVGPSVLSFAMISAEISCNNLNVKRSSL